MSEAPTAEEAGGTVWDAPNQQVVRADESPPWQEGGGGGAEATGDKTLDEMTKAELLAEAVARGVAANDSMTKDEIRAAIEAG